MTRRAQVLLGELDAGELTAERNQRVTVRFSESYAAATPRPVLGQSFEERPLDHVWTSSVRAPSWFSQLLPEGPLRRMVAEQIGVHTDHEFDLLVRLGGDLPGAVRILDVDDGRRDPQGRLPLTSSSINRDTPPDEETAPIRFSLAGVQLKWSALDGPKGLTLPAKGEAGRVLVKLPHEGHPGVPNNEHAMLSWARAAGIEVADHRLVSRDQLPWAPEWCWRGEERALLVQRFDRDGSRRIHMEDFCQLLPRLADKYGTNFDTLVRAALALTGGDGFRAMIRRLVFCVACGNSDAHAKNWSILYPDGIRPQLSPAYDLVATVLYPRYDDTLTLSLAGTTDPKRVSIDSFATLARRVGFDPDEARDVAKTQVERTRNAWAGIRDNLGLAPKDADFLEQRLGSLILFRG